MYRNLSNDFFDSFFDPGVSRRTKGYPSVNEEHEYYKFKLTLLGYDPDEVQVQINDKELIVKTTDDVHNYKYDIRDLQIEKGVKNHIKEMKGGILNVHLKKSKGTEMQEIK